MTRDHYVKLILLSINTALLENSHASSFMYCLWLLLSYSRRVEQLSQKLCALKSLTYFPSGTLLKKVVDLWTRSFSKSGGNQYLSFPQGSTVVPGLEPGGRGMDKQASLDVQCVSPRAAPAKFHKVGDLNNRHLFFRVPGARCLKSSHQHGCALSKGSRGESSLHLLGSGGSRKPLALLGLQTHHFSLCLHFHGSVSLCISVFQCPSPYKDTSHVGRRGHSNLV